jgi:hypothetical protein
MKKLIVLFMASLFAGVTHAATITGTVEVDVTENSSDNYISTEAIKLGIVGDNEVAFGSIKLKTNASDQVVLDEYFIGANLSETVSASYGEQGDIFIGGGLETVGKNTIANPVSTGESIKLNVGDFSTRFKFTDTDTDINDFSTIQATYTTTVDKFSVGASVDHTMDTDKNIYAGSIGYALNESLDISSVFTHDGSLTDEIAYESKVSMNGFSAYIDGNEGDWQKNVGAGYKSTWNGLTWYVEGNYNLDSEDVTPAMGVSLSF